MSKKRLIILLILAVLGILLLFELIGSAIFYGDPLYDFKRSATNNNPKDNIVDLTWSQGPYKIYYIKRDQGLYSQNSDGTNKKRIYDNPDHFEYFLTSDKKIVILTKDNQLLLLGESGEYIKSISQFSKDDFVSELRLSPNGQMIAALLFVDKPGGDIKTSFDDIYIINKLSGEMHRLDRDKDLSGARSVSDMLWFKDNNRILLIIHRDSDTPGKTYAVEYWIYTLVGKRTQLLGKHEATVKKGISAFVDENQLVKPEPTRYSFTYYNNTSPDKAEMVTIGNGNILVNGQEVMHWNNYHFKLNMGCSRPNWLPDNEHIVVSSQQDGCGIRIIEVATKREAKLDDGINPKWFGRAVNIPGSL